MGHLTGGERAKILGENAVRLFRFEAERLLRAARTTAAASGDGSRTRPAGG